MKHQRTVIRNKHVVSVITLHHAAFLFKKPIMYWCHWSCSHSSIFLCTPELLQAVAFLGVTWDTSLLPSQKLSVLHTVLTSFTFLLTCVFLGTSWDFFFSNFFLMVSKRPVNGFKIFLQLNQSFHFEMQFSLRKCINSISRVSKHSTMNEFIQNHCVVLFCFVFSLWSGVCIWRQNLLWRTKRNCIFKLGGLCSVWVQGKNIFDRIKILAC